MSLRSTSSLLLFVLLAAAGCGAAVDAPTSASLAPRVTATSDTPLASGDPASPPPPTITQQPQPSAAPSATGTEPAPATEPAAHVDRPWAALALTDVTTGEQFRIADIATPGKVVFVETLATWCHNCLAQQKEAVAALANVDPALVEWIGVDVETTEDGPTLARYAQRNGFPFRYVVADRELSRLLATEFGDVVLSPPSVNVIVISANGDVTHLTGSHTADEIIGLVAEHGP